MTSKTVLDKNRLPVIGWVVLAPLLLCALAAFQHWRLGGIPHAFGVWLRYGALLAGLAGLLAALNGALALHQAAAAGRRAMASRDALMAEFGRWQKTLPRTLGLTLGLSALGLALLAVLEVALILLRTQSDARLSAQLQGAMVAIVWLLAWASMLAFWRMRKAFGAYTPEPSDQMGVSVSPAQAPGLWADARALARAAGAQPPDHIVVGPTDSPYVTAHDMRLWPSKQLLTGQKLYMPLGFLRLMPVPEVQSVIAHEMAHFAGQDTAYSQRFAPMYHSFQTRLQALVNDQGLVEWSIRPAMSFGVYLLEQFHGAVRRWSRQREFAADALAAKITGAQVTANALLRSGPLMARMDHSLARLARPEAHQPPPELQAVWLPLPELNPHAVELEDETIAHPFDTHPPTAERVRAVGGTWDAATCAAMRERALRDAPQPLTHWLDQPEAFERQIYGDFQAQVKSHDAEMRTHLQEVAARAQGTVTINESNKGLIAVFAIMALFFGGLTALLWLLSTSDDPKDRLPPAMVMVAVGSGLVAIWMGWMIWRFWRRRRTPALWFSSEGVGSPGLVQPVSWDHVDEWRINQVQGGLTLILTLDAATPAPQLRHSNLGRLKYKPKKRQLVLFATTLKGTHISQAIDQVHACVNAAAARHMLRNMDHTQPPAHQG